MRARSAAVTRARRAAASPAGRAPGRRPEPGRLRPRFIQAIARAVSRPGVFIRQAGEMFPSDIGCRRGRRVEARGAERAWAVCAAEWRLHTGCLHAFHRPGGDHRGARGAAGPRTRRRLPHGCTCTRAPPRDRPPGSSAQAVRRGHALRVRPRPCTAGCAHPRGTAERGARRSKSADSGPSPRPRTESGCPRCRPRQLPSTAGRAHAAAPDA